MKGLLIKDFKLMKNQKNFLFVIFIGAIASMLLSGFSSFLMGYFPFICSFFVLSTISYDEFDNGNAFLYTLPFSRKTYVKEKYLFGFLAGTAGCIISLIITVLYRYFTHTGFSLTELLVPAAAVLMILIIILSFMLPIHLKFGGEKGRYALFGIFLFLVLFGGIGLQFLPLEVLGEFLHALKPAGFLSLLAVFTFVFTFISYRISVLIQERKEF